MPAPSPDEKRKVKRGAVQKKESVFLGLWVPKKLLNRLDRHVERIDSDRSKFMRAAIREKYQRLTEASK